MLKQQMLSQTPASAAQQVRGAAARGFRGAALAGPFICRRQPLPWRWGVAGL
jgi:hypothetical protein